MDIAAFRRWLGRRIRRLREDHGLTQEQFELYGIGWKTVQKIEYGKSDPRATTLFKFAKAFKMSLSEMLRIDELPPRRPRARAVPEVKSGKANGEDDGANGGGGEGA
jgi:transcriptional regulator with XRE-family HTH domain